MKTRKALDRLIGRPGPRPASISATTALTDMWRPRATSRNASQNSASSEMLVRCPARTTERFLTAPGAITQRNPIRRPPLLHELAQQGRRITVAVLDESDELRALILAENDEEFAQRAAGFDLEATPIVRRLLEQLVDRRLVGLLLGEFLPGIVDQGHVRLAQMARLQAHRADEA